MAGMEAMMDSPMVMVQYGLALAVPAVLTAIINLGCGKKRDQPPRPGAAQKALSKTAKTAGASSKSKRASKSSSASAKSGKRSKKNKSGKSKKSASKEKSRKSLKSGKKSSGKDKSSKSKKSKRELKSKTGAVAAAGGVSDAAGSSAKQPSSATSAGKLSAEKLASQKTAVALDNSAKSAPTQVASASLKQPPSGGALDANANVVDAPGTTAIVAIAADSGPGLKMEPAELRWSSAGGMQKISLINQSAERQAIKVKCSDNNVYRVNPVYAIVEPGQTLNVDVMRQNGSNKVDKIVFVTARAGLEENSKNAFKSGAPSAMMVLPLLATSAQNQPALAF